MSTREPQSGETADLIISGRVGALRELAEPAPLTDLQLKIIHWYGELQRPLSGPRSGNERGPAQQPGWVKHGPRLGGVGVDGDRRELSYVVEGSGLGDTTAVLLDGGFVRGWQVVSAGQLRVPIPEKILAGRGEEVSIEIRTPLGDLVVWAEKPSIADLTS